MCLSAREPIPDSWKPIGWSVVIGVITWDFDMSTFTEGCKGPNPSFAGLGTPLDGLELPGRGPSSTYLGNKILDKGGRSDRCTRKYIASAISKIKAGIASYQEIRPFIIHPCSHPGQYFPN